MSEFGVFGLEFLNRKPVLDILATNVLLERRQFLLEVMNMRLPLRATLALVLTDAGKSVGFLGIECQP